jgi:hypothetical protein
MTEQGNKPVRKPLNPKVAAMFSYVWDAAEQDQEKPSQKGTEQNAPKKAHVQVSTEQAKFRVVENVKNWPRRVKSDFYELVRALNKYDKDRKGPYSPLNGALAAEYAWAEEDKRGSR